jgi:tRNA pseudouridine38-40 synthase
MMEDFMKRVMLKIAYDGTNYCGWQIQKNGTAVEAVINEKLSELLGEEIVIIGASRTDSGVHAMGNIAVFDTDTKIPPDKICFALNQRLPHDITIQGSKEVPADFHPRHCNCSKTYEYKILNRKFDLPVYRLYSHFFYYPLDLEQMQKAAEYLVGEHDFASFASNGGQAKTTVRTVNSLELFKEGDMITMRINGNGFLYNMVRIIAGTLIKVGVHAYPPEHVKEILDARNRNAAGPKAPARGLTLVEICYEEEFLQISP